MIDLAKMTKRFDINLERRGSLVAMIRLEVHREQDQVDYDGGNFELSGVVIEEGTNDLEATDSCVDEPLSIPALGEMMSRHVKNKPCYIIQLVFLPRNFVLTSAATTLA